MQTQAESAGAAPGQRATACWADVARSPVSSGSSPYLFGHDERFAVVPRQQLVRLGGILSDELLGGGVELQLRADVVLQAVQRDAVVFEMLLHSAQRLIGRFAPREDLAGRIQLRFLAQ